MSDNFWTEALVVVFFFYGLAFYSMGLALLIESGRSSQLSLARSIRLLAGFGLLHGAHEWLEMFDHGLRIYYDRSLPLWVSWIRVSLLATSFVALLVFGESLLKRDRARLTLAWRLTLGAIGWYAVSVIVIQIAYNLNDVEWAEVADVLARYVIGIPGATLACIALLQQRRVFRERDMGRFSQDLTLAAAALLLYGVVGQFFTRETKLFPSTVINADHFRQVMGFPVQVFRAATAGVVAYSMIHVLRVLEVENRQELEAMRQAKVEAEQYSRQTLTRLNSELKAANEEAVRLLQEVQRRDALRGVLLQRITTAQESERRRIARELHDDIGQALTGIGMGLRGSADLAKRYDDNAAAQQLEAIQQMATTALGSLRVLINDLRPPQLDDIGLVATIRWQIDRLCQRCPIDILLEISGDPVDLPLVVETSLFRIVQEGLNNIVKHARARCAWVILDFSEGLRLTIRDDGVGFDLDAAFNTETSRTAWGLLGMQERASLVNADFTLETAPGQGTRVTIYLADIEKEMPGEHSFNGRR